MEAPNSKLVAEKICERNALCGGGYSNIYYML